VSQPGAVVTAELGDGFQALHAGPDGNRCERQDGAARMDAFLRPRGLMSTSLSPTSDWGLPSRFIPSHSPLANLKTETALTGRV
jgi:hypothetical protein